LRTADVEYAIKDIITHAREYEKKKGKNVIYLNIGDPVQYDFPTPDHIKNALIKAVQNNETTILHPNDNQSIDRPL
jgi:alanine-synthesizing transaminase